MKLGNVKIDKKESRKILDEISNPEKLKISKEQEEFLRESIKIHRNFINKRNQ